MNAREKSVAIADWLGWQNEDLSFGLRSAADAERLYDYWQKRGDTLPEMADEAWYSETGKEADRVDLAEHRIAALGYDPLDPECDGQAARDAEIEQTVQALQDRLAMFKGTLEHYRPGPGRVKLEAKQAATRRALARFDV